MIPIRSPTTGPTDCAGAVAGRSGGPVAQLVSFWLSSMSSACVSLPARSRGPGASRPRRIAHHAQALGRLEGADQHGRADSLGLDDGVGQRVDPVGAVDVGAPPAARTGPGCGRHADMGVGGRLGLVVGLGLDDPAGGLPVLHHAAHQRRARPRARARSGSCPRGSGGPPSLGPAPRASELLAHACERGPALGDLRLEPRRAGRGASSSSSSSCGGARELFAVELRSGAPGVDAARTRPATTPCDSRNGTPRRTSRSATSVAAIRSSAAAAAMRSRSKLIVASMPLGRREREPSVSTASKGAPCPPGGPCCRSAAGPA